MVGMCRLCASLRKKDALHVIKDDDEEVCVELRACCAVDVRLSDLLPKFVCFECLDMLHAFHGFHAKVQQSQEALSIMFNANASKKEESAEAANKRNDPTPTKPSSMSSVEAEEAEEEPMTGKKADDILIEYVNLYDEKQPNNDEQVNEKLSNVVIQLLENDNMQVDEDEQEHEHNNDTEELVEEEYEQLENEEEEYDVNVTSEAVSEAEDTDLKPHEHDDELSCFIVEESNDKNANDYSDDDDEEQNLEVKEGKMQVIQSNLNVNVWSEYEWLCFMCEFYAHDLVSLYKHARSEHKLEKLKKLQYRCTDCQKISSHYYQFIHHVRLNHYPQLALCCDVCDLQLEDLKQLSEHRSMRQCKPANSLNITAKDYPIVENCNVCGKTFDCKEKTLGHARRLHKQVKEDYKCPTCDKVLISASSLRKHLDVHSDARPFVCDICGHGFRQKINLDTHYTTHIKTSSGIICVICKKTFKSSANLQKHTLLHSDVKPFKCSYCPKSFRAKNTQITHERTHTGEAPYKCKYCDKRFSFRSTLNVHLNVHTGERPYTCFKCLHDFTNWSNYNKHMMRKHNLKGKAKKDILLERMNVLTEAGDSKTDNSDEEIVVLLQD